MESVCEDDDELFAVDENQELDMIDVLVASDAGLVVFDACFAAVVAGIEREVEMDEVEFDELYCIVG